MAKDYATTLLRMAGNIASGQGNAFNAYTSPEVRKREIGIVASYAVDVARAILEKVVPNET